MKHDHRELSRVECAKIICAIQRQEGKYSSIYNTRTKKAIGFVYGITDIGDHWTGWIGEFNIKIKRTGEDTYSLTATDEGMVDSWRPDRSDGKNHCDVDDGLELVTRHESGRWLRGFIKQWKETGTLGLSPLWRADKRLLL